MQQAKRITKVEGVRSRTPIEVIAPSKRKVAAYARVSTSSEEQLTSYEAQVDYFTKHIKANPSWEFVGIYTDEGISATSMKKREGFNRMVTDALDGKVELIITKSISRFARNTVDCLTTIRKLKEFDVEVYFEKENIYTLDSKGEMLITILSSFAQQESLSLSSNVTWGIRKRFSDGKVSLPYKQFLGYEKGEDGLPKIVESEAKIIRLIYRLFLEGWSCNSIAKHLTGQGIKTPGGKDQWHSTTVKSILINEKYRGNAILQKRYTVDYLTKKTKENEGEVPKYFVENSHPAIVTAEQYLLAQEELKRRKETPGLISTANCFSGRIICGECGSQFGPKLWHSTSKYKRVVWQCNHKFQSEHKCRTPHLYEDDIKNAFMSVVSEVLENRESIKINLEQILKEVLSPEKSERKIRTAKDKLEHLERDIKACVAENARKPLNQDAYNKRYIPLAEEYDRKYKDLAELESELESLLRRREIIGKYLSTIEGLSIADGAFDIGLWNVFVEKVMVELDGRIEFVLHDGRKVIRKI
jgi:DNA invertase Pin-like site-specific DNA recombinase